MSLKPLGIVRDIIESAGIGIFYAYDDLVFLEHNAFILQFTDKSDEIILYINSEADEDAIRNSINIFNNAAAARDMVIVKGKYYTLVQADEENVRLEFMEIN